MRNRPSVESGLGPVTVHTALYFRKEAPRSIRRCAYAADSENPLESKSECSCFSLKDDIISQLSLFLGRLPLGIIRARWSNTVCICRSTSSRHRVWSGDWSYDKTAWQVVFSLTRKRCAISESRLFSQSMFSHRFRTCAIVSAVVFDCARRPTAQLQRFLVRPKRHGAPAGVVQHHQGLGRANPHGPLPDGSAGVDGLASSRVPPIQGGEACLRSSPRASRPALHPRL